MTTAEIKKILSDLQSLTAETEVVEFKKAETNYDFKKLGKYFSALSNEANLSNLKYAWLVFGIDDKTHNIVGTGYRTTRKDLDSLKGEIASKTTNNITFIDIYELHEPQGRVVLFQIPAAPRGIPIAFEGHFYGRNGEETAPLNLEKLDRIRSQANIEDWSAGIILEATLGDLDQKAIAVARDNYKSKFPYKAEEVDGWDDITFLNKAKLTIKGKITRTAIILLGKEESEHFISPAEAKIRWVLKDAQNNDKDYDTVGCPLLLAVNIIYSKIRNLKYRYLKTDKSLFPEEVDMYEPYAIREAINNCIAHQDYTKGGRINVIEKDDCLIFTNLGSFIPGSVEKVVIEDAPEEHYRNRFLAAAMFNLKMVDTAGGGIKKMFNYQRARFFPMPEYDLSGGKVKVTLTGKVLNMDYANLLANNTDLGLNEIMLLDKVQKKLPITTEGERLLKSKHLIEGRRPNFFIGINVAQKTGQKAVYTKNRAFDQKYYLDLMTAAIKQHNRCGRKDFDELLWDKLPDWMTVSQKKVKINNLIAILRQREVIINIGTDRNSIWVLYKE